MTRAGPTTEPEAPGALRDAQSLVDTRLAALIDGADVSERLRAVLRYAALDGGKRLRPAMALASCRAAGGEDEAAVDAMAAVELIHAFSLVHDDLPAMDDDDLRRGRPTAHVAYGEALAILAGDAMMSLAFETLLRDGRRGAALARELSVATTAMIAGQVDDTEGVDEPLDDEAKVRRIHARKTGALVRAACRMGGLGAGAAGESLDALSRFGERVGLAYQIVDDLLDVEQPPERVGKRTGKDAERGTLTFPSVLGVERSREEAARLTDEAIAALEPLGGAAGDLRALARHIGRRTA